MTVTVHLPYVLRDLAGGEVSVDVDGRTVREALSALDRRFPGMQERLVDERGVLLGHVIVFVDGEDVRRTGQGMDAALEDHAEVSILQAMSGG